MTNAEANDYWKPARQAFGGNKIEHSRLLATVLGLTYPHYMYYAKIELTDDLKHKLTMLVGPHGKTIAAAMLAKAEA